jgi:hypothetical protein
LRVVRVVREGEGRTRGRRAVEGRMNGEKGSKKDGEIGPAR